MLKIRRPLGRLIFNMGIAIPGKTVFLIETAPWWHNYNNTKHNNAMSIFCGIYCICYLPHITFEWTLQCIGSADCLPSTHRMHQNFVYGLINSVSSKIQTLDTFYTMWCYNWVWFHKTCIACVNNSNIIAKLPDQWFLFTEVMQTGPPREFSIMSATMKAFLLSGSISTILRLNI